MRPVSLLAHQNPYPGWISNQTRFWVKASACKLDYFIEQQNMTEL